MYIQTTREESQSLYHKESITLTYFGRSHKFVNDLLEWIEPKSKIDKMNTNIFINKEWHSGHDTQKIDWNNIYLDNITEKTVIDHFDNFYNNQEFWLQRNIPYRTGILLHGKPGTGKTTLIKAIATRYNKGVNILPASEIKLLREAILTMDRNSILVIEDIDSIDALHSRDLKDEGNVLRIKGDNEVRNLSDILNVFDGILDFDGRVVIFTTNKPDVLDEAMTRPGRIDLKVNIDYFNMEQLIKWLVRNFTIDADEKKYLVNHPGLEINHGVTIAKLTNELLRGLSVREILEGNTKCTLIGEEVIC